MNTHPSSLEFPSLSCLYPAILAECRRVPVPKIEQCEKDNTVIDNGSREVIAYQPQHIGRWQMIQCRWACLSMRASGRRDGGEAVGFGRAVTTRSCLWQSVFPGQRTVNKQHKIDGAVSWRSFQIIAWNNCFGHFAGPRLSWGCCCLRWLVNLRWGITLSSD